MTEREKIIEIIKRNGTYNGRSLSFDYYVVQPDDLADALIAAGIGDVGETKEKLKKINERILLGDIIACDLSAKCAEYKYRADVAERELRNITERASCAICDNFNCKYYNGETRKYNAEECIKWWLVQAEKELEEEKKNEI